MGLYDDALNEYLAEDENGKHKLMYAYFGLAVYFGQCLEETFSFMLWSNRIFTKQAKTNAEVNQIIDEIESSKKTMGYFINEVKQTYDLTEDSKRKLKDLLGKRNYLVHKYFKEHTEKFFSDLGKKEMLYYFCTFIEESKKLDVELKEYSSIYYHKLGMTEEILQKMMDDMKKEEKRREVNAANNTLHRTYGPAGPSVR